MKRANDCHIEDHTANEYAYCNHWLEKLERNTNVLGLLYKIRSLAVIMLKVENEKRREKKIFISD